MKLEDVTPAHCHARARQLLSLAVAIREEMGRAEDTRALPEISGAQPREVYFEAIVAWRKTERLAAEVGAAPIFVAFEAPSVLEIRPGHVLRVLDGVRAQLLAVADRIGVTERPAEPAIEAQRQPSDVLSVVLHVNRELSRALSTPFTPGDVYRTVALASQYANRFGAHAALAPFERKRRPADCYERLEACLTRTTALIKKQGHEALAARGTPTEIVPGDVYDLANLVLGEVAYLHALAPNAAPMQAFEPEPSGARLPSHVHQLARTLEAQLASLT